jgi:hypothetical protein
MADNPMNKSNKGPANVGPDFVDEGELLAQIRRIGQRSTKTETDTRYEESLRNAENTLAGVPAARAAGALNSQDASDISRQAQDTIVKETRRLNSSIQGSIQRGEAEARNVIRGQYSRPAMNRQITAAQKELGTQTGSFEYMNMAPHELEALKEQTYSELRQQERGVRSSVNGLFIGAPVSDIGSSKYKTAVNYEKASEIEAEIAKGKPLYQRLAKIGLAEKASRIAGTDPASVFGTTLERAEQASAFTRQQQYRDDLKSTGAVNIGGKSIAAKDMFSEFMKASKEAAEALQALKDKTGDAETNMEKLNSATTKAAELQKAIGSGGGGGFSRTQIAAAGASMINILGGTAQEVAINQRMGQMANITGYADLANQQYDMYKKARGGDVASQMMLMRMGEAQNFGKEMQTATGLVQKAQQAGAVVQGAQGYFQVAEGGTGKVVGAGGQLLGTGSLSTNEVIAGYTNIAQATGTGISVTSDIHRGVTSEANKLQAIQASMAAQQALLSVSSQQRQVVRDFSVGLGQAGMMMGGGDANRSFLSGSMTTANLNRMSEARMSPQQYAALAAQGAGEMGSAFNKEQIYAARGYERSGYGPAAEQMQRMTTLAGVGSNNPQAGLGAVMEQAFTKGLESSKAISMMVENTAAMAQSSVSMAAGLDITGASAAVLAGNMAGNTKNDVFDVKRAMTAQQVAKDVVTNTDISFSGMVNTSRIQRTTGLSGIDSLEAAKLSKEDLLGLKGKSGADIKAYMTQRGITTTESGAGGLVDQLLRNQVTTMFEGKGSAFSKNVNTSTRKQLEASTLAGVGYAQLPEELKIAVGKLAQDKGVSGEEYYRSAGIYTPDTTKARGKVNKAEAGKGGTAEQGDLDLLRTGPMAQLADAASSATTQLGGFSKALKALVDLQKGVEAKGVETEDKARDLAGKLTDEANFGKEDIRLFNQSTALLTGAAGKLNKFADALMERSGVHTTGSVLNPQVEKFLDQKFGLKKGG